MNREGMENPVKMVLFKQNGTFRVELIFEKNESDLFNIVYKTYPPSLNIYQLFKEKVSIFECHEN